MFGSGTSMSISWLTLSVREHHTGEEEFVNLPDRQGSGLRSSAPGTLTGRAASRQRGLMPLGQCMRWNDARGSAVCTGRAYARQGMMASTVFFSALGWAGDLVACRCLVRACLFARLVAGRSSLPLC